MMALETVASGTGWSLTREPGSTDLILSVRGHEFTARPKGVEVVLPPEFVAEFLRQKRAVRQAGNEAQAAEENET